MINLTKEDVQTFLEAIPTKHLDKKLFYKLQYFYCRRSIEVLNLKVSSIDFKQDTITFDIAKKKEKTSFMLPLEKSLKQELIGYIKTSKLEDNDNLFKNTIGAYKKYLERNSKKILIENLGVDIKLSTHDFRKLGSQHLYLDGLELETIQRILKHEDLKTTLIYLQIDDLIAFKSLENVFSTIASK